MTRSLGGGGGSFWCTWNVCGGGPASLYTFSLTGGGESRRMMTVLVVRSSSVILICVSLSESSVLTRYTRFSSSLEEPSLSLITLTCGAGSECRR